MLNNIEKSAIDNGENLVIILSARRAGSTLLQNILCQSPQTHSFVSEAQFLTHLLDAFEWGDMEFSRMLQGYFESKITYTQFQKETVTRFIISARENLKTKKLLILKNPELSLHTEKLVELLPFCKFIVLARDPRDQITSEFAVAERQLALEWINQIPSIQDLCNMYDRYYAAIERGRNKCPDSFLTVRFESIIERIEFTLKTLEQFLAMDLSAYDPQSDWKNDMVDWESMKKRPSWSKYYGKPLSTEPVGSFTQTLDLRQIRIIEDRLSNWMHLFDYPLSNHEIQ